MQKATIPQTSVAFASSGVVCRSLLSRQFHTRSTIPQTSVSSSRKLRGCLWQSCRISATRSDTQVYTKVCTKDIITHTQVYKSMHRRHNYTYSGVRNYAKKHIIAHTQVYTKLRTKDIIAHTYTHIHTSTNTHAQTRIYILTCTHVHTDIHTHTLTRTQGARNLHTVLRCTKACTNNKYTHTYCTRTYTCTICTHHYHEQNTTHTHTHTHKLTHTGFAQPVPQCIRGRCHSKAATTLGG